VDISDFSFAFIVRGLHSDTKLYDLYNDEN